MPTARFEPPYYPIVYVRGYAGTQDEVEETVATPFMGFNLGATKARQRWDGQIVRHVFESPLVRLMKDFGYQDVYSHGSELLEADEPNERPIVIYRYYEPVSKVLGEGHRGEIEDYARGLSELIDRLRDAWSKNTGRPASEFRVYLVAHSMGGLIVRCFLQNRNVSSPTNRKTVDKVFTYATPHGGIDIRVIGNMPSFLTRNNKDNFNRARMREFLALGNQKDVQTLNDRYPCERFFCLVGTNADDYTVAKGWSARLVGELSDGLVRIDNAFVRGAPRAFVHRSHSGHFGIVNSEEGFQNLTRFLFGDVRVDGVLRVDEIDLPSKVKRAYEADKEIRASYHFEVVLRTRRSRTILHSRTVREGSAIFREFDELLRVAPSKRRHPHLFSVFLSTHGRKNASRGPLVFAVDLRVRVPDYEIDGFAFFDQHVEGSYLLRRTIMLAAVPPDGPNGAWKLRYGTNPLSERPTPKEVEPVPVAEGSDDGRLVFQVPIERQQRPGITGTLELTARPWS